MTPGYDAKERFEQCIVRALSKIKKPSTAEEITELLNQELSPCDRTFRSEEVEIWLRDRPEKVIQLYWLAIRPRR